MAMHRRKKLSLKFALKCVKNESIAWMFQKKMQQYDTRFPEKFVVTSAKTDSIAKSAIPYMQKLLNTHARK